MPEDGLRGCPVGHCCWHGGPAAPHRRRLRALHAQLRRPGTGSASPSRAEAAASAYADDSLRADPHGKVHFVEVEPNVLLCANIYRPTNSDVHPVPVVLAHPVSPAVREQRQ